MELYPGIEIRDLGLYIVKAKTLVIGDLHVGYEEALNRQGVMLPHVHFEEMKDRISKILDDVETVVINGDLKHEFGRILSSEWKYTKELLRLFEGRRLVFVQGNHDRILKPLVRGMELVDFFSLDDIFITHGDTIPDAEGDVIIIGHEHPALALKEGVRIEKFKCFLVGKWKEKTLIVMPSYNLATKGTDILRERLLSPYLQGDLKNFDVFVISDTIYPFGKVKAIKRRI